MLGDKSWSAGESNINTAVDTTDYCQFGVRLLVYYMRVSDGSAAMMMLETQYKSDLYV